MMMMSVVPKSRNLCREEFKANSKSPFDFRKSSSFSTETWTRVQPHSVVVVVTMID